MLVALVAIGAFFAWHAPAFLSARNLSLLSVELAVTAVLALGMLLVILPGHIDLSVGSGLGLFGAVAAVLVFHAGWPAPLALALAAAAAVVVYALMGAVIVREQMPAFIITLGGLLTFKGVHWLVIENATVPVVAGGRANAYSLLTTLTLSRGAGLAVAAVLAAGGATLLMRGRGDRELRFLRAFVFAQLVLLAVLVANQYRGVPVAALILFGVAGAVHVLTSHTPFGRYLYAIGGNEEAARIAGVPVGQVVVAAFAINGAIVALSGFLQTAYAGASTTTIGALMELDAIAACVIGGASLKGGRGTVLGVLFGALIMAVLLNGMTLLAVSPELKYIARGVVLALAVWMDVRLSSARS